MCPPRRFPFANAARRAFAGGFMAAIVTVSATVALSAAQQSTDSTATPVFRLPEVEVTATRTLREVFRTPAPVSVLDTLALRRLQPQGVGDALRELPGVDVTGVGLQQRRPIIRGLRGQRILMLQDGLRLNNARRQQDFGELPGLIDLGQVDRIEVVRGPSSVLYGSDALGGVVNIITDPLRNRSFGGRLSYEFNGGYDASTIRGRVSGATGRVGYEVSGHWRTGNAYSAPAGSFGDIELSDDVAVLGSGIDDWSVSGRLSADLSPGHTLSAFAEGYRAEDAGFGFVEPEAYAAALPRIDIHYPEQTFTRFGLSYDGFLGSAVADEVTVQGYTQGNDRDLVFDFFQGFGPEAPPDAGVAIDNRNHTDLSSVGLRAEAQRQVGSVRLTYGVEGFRDAATSSDTSRTTVTGFGPPSVEETTTPRVPDATYWNIGLFGQGERSFGRLTLVAGARFQAAGANTKETPGLPESGEVDRSVRTVVGALNGIFEASDHWALIGSVSRGFRAPNLIEWFFEGPVPEARAFQLPNPDLEAETSLNLDFGLRFRSDRVSAEAFVFQNTLFDGIRSEVTGDSIQGFAVFQSRNLDELRYRGAEVVAGVEPGAGFRLSGSYTHLSSEDVLDPDNPTGETFSNRWIGRAGWTQPGGRLWAEWGIRHNGEQRGVDLTNNPLGSTLPAFTVHHARLGLRPDPGASFSTGLTLGVENLGNSLYAEFPNASFFRPEPGRRVVLTAELAF